MLIDIDSVIVIIFMVYYLLILTVAHFYREQKTQKNTVGEFTVDVIFTDLQLFVVTIRAELILCIVNLMVDNRLLW